MMDFKELRAGQSPAFVRLPDVLAAEGVSRSTLYERVLSGVMVPPVALGLRAKGWPAHELATLREARAAGATNDDLRALVSRLVTNRARAVQRLRDELRGGA